MEDGVDWSLQISYSTADYSTMDTLAVILLVFEINKKLQY